jgi:CBS domain-containing protein
MKVRDLMHRDVTTVDADAPVQRAVVLMAQQHVSALPVTDGLGRMVGVLSSSDVLAAEAEAEDERARSFLLDGTAVRDLMTPAALTVDAGEDVREAARQMLYGEVHRLFVAEEGRVSGVISSTDIVRAVAQGKL